MSPWAGDMRDLFGSLPVRMWGCPDGHSFRHHSEPPCETVRWINGIAHCMEPGCGRTSADKVVPDA